MKIDVIYIHLSILYTRVILLSVAGGLESVPAVIRREVGYSVGIGSVHLRATQRQTSQTTMASHTLTFHHTTVYTQICVCVCVCVCVFCSFAVYTYCPEFIDFSSSKDSCK